MAPAVRSDEEGLDAGGDDYGSMGGYGGDDYGGGDYGGGGGYDDYGNGGADTTPAFTLLDDVDSVKKFLADEDTEPAVIGFFNEETNKADIEAFEEAATTYRYEMRFAYSTEDDVRTAYKAKGGSKVEVYKPPRFVADKYDKPKARYPGKTVDATALGKFFKKKSIPLVGQKTWKSNDRYEAAGLPVLTLFAAVDLEKNAKGFDYYANRLRKVAVDHTDKLAFNIGDKEDFSYLLDDYGLELPGKKDIGVGIKDGANHFAMAESFSVDNLRAFVAAYQAGSLTPKVKEEPDYSSDAGSEDDGYGDDDEDDGEPSEVVTLTGDNFDEVVNAPGVDAMVEFYAPWCGHCMQLKPIYKKLAAAFKGTPTVAVAAMDATAHDPPAAFEVQGYPTIIFVKGDDKANPVPYEGGRDLESMVDFIKANAATPVNDEL